MKCITMLCGKFGKNGADPQSTTAALKYLESSRWLLDTAHCRYHQCNIDKSSQPSHEEMQRSFLLTNLMKDWLAGLARAIIGIFQKQWVYSWGVQTDMPVNGSLSSAGSGRPRGVTICSLNASMVRSNELPGIVQVTQRVTAPAPHCRTRPDRQRDEWNTQTISCILCLHSGEIDNRSPTWLSQKHNIIFGWTSNNSTVVHVLAFGSCRVDGYQWPHQECCYRWALPI